MKRMVVFVLVVGVLLILWWRRRQDEVPQRILKVEPAELEDSYAWRERDKAEENPLWWEDDTWKRGGVLPDFTFTWRWPWERH